MNSFEFKGQNLIDPNSELFLVADIGGTDTNFAVFDDHALQMSANFKSEEIENFTGFIKEILEH